MRGLSGSASRAATSAGSSYSQSLPRRYCPETFSPNRSETAWALRKSTCISDRSPPATDTVLPGLSIGECVMMCMTPSAALGPYRAAPGPRASSIRSMSMSVVGIMLIALIRSAGIRAYRLSTMLSRRPEATLLKPRTTT